MNGFLMILDCQGELFFATHSIETYLGFHQVRLITFPFNNLRPVSCGSSQPIIALTIASSHSCHEFLFEIIRCLNPDHGVAKFLDEGGSVFIE